MATPVDFAGSNLLLTAPPGCEDSVIPLPVLRDNGQIVSCWGLSADEIREIAETGVIWLSVWGDRTAPPVFVSGCRNEVIA